MYVQADAGEGLRRSQGDSIAEEQEKKRSVPGHFFTIGRNQLELFWAEPIIKVTLYDGFSGPQVPQDDVKCFQMFYSCFQMFYRCFQMF